ncbi:hypothetical protein V8C26DRAFT_99199 [Trichoderma gracile]
MLVSFKEIACGWWCYIPCFAFLLLHAALQLFREIVSYSYLVTLEIELLQPMGYTHPCCLRTSWCRRIFAPNSMGLRLLTRGERRLFNQFRRWSVHTKRNSLRVPPLSSVRKAVVEALDTADGLREHLHDSCWPPRGLD